MALTRERILTDNEKYGVGFLDESTPGIWLVAGVGAPMPSALFTNRQAAEEYIYAKCDEHGLQPMDYSLSVWVAHETWPPADEGDE